MTLTLQTVRNVSRMFYTFFHYFLFPAICRDLALTENTSLNSLKFVVMPGFDAQSPWPTTVLSTVQSKLIRDITLAVMPQAYHKVLDALDWSVIDERRELQRVTVWLHEPEMRFNRLRVPITVLTLLPKCRERGTLHLFSSKPFYRSQRPLVHHGFKCYRFDVDELNLRSLFNL